MDSDRPGAGRGLCSRYDSRGPAGLYDAVDGIVKKASSPVETYEALKTLFNSDDVWGKV